AEDEAPVFTDADEVRRDVERLLGGTTEHELLVVYVLDYVLLAGRRDRLQPIDRHVEVVLDGTAGRQVLTREEVRGARADERLSGTCIHPPVGERNRLRKRRPGSGAGGADETHPAQCQCR